MTRQSPDGLDHGSEHYSLYPCLSLLPAGHPRWDHCNIAPGDSTANYRGYSARWMVWNGSLYLKSFGGYADDGFGRLSRTKVSRRPIGMIDVHEVDTPVPARWISCDLVCPAGRALNTGWSDFIPERFVLFRVVRGLVVAEMSVPNIHRVEDVQFRHGTSLLGGLVAREGHAPPESAPASVKGLARALREPGEGAARRHLAAMLWSASRADLEVLSSALSTSRDPDVLRWTGYTLAGIGPDAADAIPHVMRVLSATADPEIAQAMAYALGGIGPAAAPVFAAMIPIVEACCDGKAADQILHFVDTVASAGPEMIDVLIAGMLASRHRSVRARIAWILGKMGLAAVLPLYAAFLAADDDQQRSALAEALGCVGPGAGIALDALLDTLRQAQHDDVRWLVAEAVSKIGLRSPDSLSALRTAFRAATDNRVLRLLADAAASLGGKAVGFLVEELAAAGKEGRIQIARVLGEIGAEAAPAVGPLAQATTTATSRTLIVEVAASLKKIGAPEDVLFTARIKALGVDRYGHWRLPVLAEMQVALDDGLRLPDQDVRNLVALLVEVGESPIGRCVAKMLGTVGKAAAEPLLIALDQVRDQRTRVVIFHALGQVGEPAGSALDDAVGALSAAADDRVRLQIIDDLVRLGRPDERHMATIAEVLVRSSFLPVWWRLGLVLAAFGAPAVATLVRILDHASDDGLCRAMENALMEAAASDAATGAALLAAVRCAKRPRTIKALQTALNRAAPR
ncbi:HEAT repeat domain-containing protein [Methylobacterium sp. WL7]|uniref:HEAT repeat domain-containing protein n=1 Tax=Methylobacterium sp. WL7 TaxID=2603900 RepID=UPI0011DBC7C8|nr:HEAT repeat domain-containing protein [Methylobacterium sp. WL7]TXN42918.1 HEAT repeat domain-containing protein [Methylobacterium sp. WL7]